MVPQRRTGTGGPAVDGWEAYKDLKDQIDKERLDHDTNLRQYCFEAANARRVIGYTSIGSSPPNPLDNVFTEAERIFNYIRSGSK
jgi:hypothetical protein